MGNHSLGFDDNIRPAGPAFPSSIGDSHRHMHTSFPSPENKRKRRFQDDPFHVASSRAGPRVMATPHLHANGGGMVKRARMSYHATVPLRRRLEALDHSQLMGLVESLVERHPELAPAVEELTPRLTAERALRTLHSYYQQVVGSLPYSKGDQGNDYAFLRVQPKLEEFFVSLADYVAAFLPPHATELTRTFEFLNGATELVHMLPEWTTPDNNALRNRAYLELAKAWSKCLADASGMLAFSINGAPWANQLIAHNERSGGRMGIALERVNHFGSGNLRPVADVVC